MNITANIIRIIIENEAYFQELIKEECFSALLKIREILYDDSLSDSECFYKIEEIVCVLGVAGFECGNRHDF